MTESTISVKTSAGSGGDREAFIANGLRNKMRGVIVRDAGKIARTAAAALERTGGPRRREASVAEALRETFGGVVYRDALRIARAIVEFNARFETLLV